MKRNRTKRILSMLLTLCMVLTLVPMTAFAVDTYTLTIVNGVKAGEGGETSVVCEAESAFNIKANEAPEGKVFDKWVSTVSGVPAGNGNSTTWFTMPAQDVIVTATYKNNPETDTELRGITVNVYKGGWQNPALTPAFDRGTRSYSLNLTAEYNTIYFYLGKQATGQTIIATVDGVALTGTPATGGFDTANHTLTKATTVFVFTITAKDGITNSTYTVTVNRGSGITHAVTVTGGTTATPTPADGDIVTITANEPDTGMVFDKWTTSDGVTFGNANSATTTFVMPTKAVTVTATYKNNPETDTELRNIKVFAYKSGWQNPALTPAFVKGTRSYSLNLTSEYTLIYFYLDQQATGQTITATVDGVALTGTTKTNGFETDTHTLTKATTVFVFTIKAKDGSTTGTYTVTVNRESGTTHAVTVSSGTGGGSFAEGDTVTITANEPAETGKVFDKWTTADGVTFGDENNATTTFTMLAKAVTVTATYKDTAAVNKAALTAAISGANTNKTTATESTDGKDVDPANKWVTKAVMTAYTDAIAAAQTVVDKADATQTEVDDAVTALATATSKFDGAKADGTKPAAVVKTALTDAITAANTNKGTATVSTDGTDVDPANKWVTTAVMTAYTDAITIAQAVVDKADATQTEVNNAVTTLNTATSTFDTAKADGTKPAAVNKAALTAAISGANTNKTTAVVSTDGKDVDPANKWVTTAVMTAYTDAIAAAQTVVENADATQTEVDDAVTALGTATSTFDDAKKVGTKPAAAVNKSALTAAITAANTNKGTATESTDGKDVDPANKWVTKAVMTAYTDAIAAAQTVVENADATQTEVNNAVAALVTATSTFNGAKADGTKPAPTYAVTVNSGTGGGSFAEGATVTITANAPATGKVFDKWTTSDGITFANEYALTTTFTMPAKAVTVTANYSKNSSGGGSSSGGSTVTAPENKVVIKEAPTSIKNQNLISVKEIGKAFTQPVDIRLKDDPKAKELILESLKDKFGSAADNMAIFAIDISAFAKGTDTKVQPANGTSVEITCPIPESLVEHKDSIKVVCIIDGELTVLETKVVKINDVYCVRFEATHFSPYAMVVDTTDDLNSKNDSSTSEKADNPKTSDNALVIISAVAILSITALGIVSKKNGFKLIKKSKIQ